MHAAVKKNTAAWRERKVQKRARKAALQRAGPVTDAAAVAKEVMRRLEAHTLRYQLPGHDADLEPEHVPRGQTLNEQLLTAVRIRDSIDRHKPTLLCSACSCFVGRDDVHEECLALADVPNLDLLVAEGGEVTDELPRHAITTLAFAGAKYCLDPDGVTAWAEQQPQQQPQQRQPTHVRMCTRCFAALLGKRVPDFSLVRSDTGPWPRDELGLLPEVTCVEEQLLASTSVVRRVMIMRPGSGRCDPASCKKQLTGHVMVLPGPPVEQLATMLPRTFDDLAEFLTVRVSRT